MFKTKQMVAPNERNDEKHFSVSASTVGTVSSINANSNTEGTVVVKNVPIDFIKKLGIGTSIELKI